MPNQQGGRWRREKGKLTQVAEPPKEQRFGAHAEHPSVAEAHKPAPAKASSGAKSSTNVKGKDDVNATS
ncbi:hypothetical protein [Vreelandella populi]|uniref:hypothetical protein n=1 Tax=Vreelandella populi TaxID=2498858 RepID=UPI000F8CF307|nr:hypothetical protein [Halomonas populi]RUR51526.1 hypothetical protein ELY40_17165 [Halomonas populi]